MGNSQPAVIPPQPIVPENKTRICVAGFPVSHNCARAHKLATFIAKKYPAQYETWFYFDSGSHYYDFLKVKFDPVPFPDHLKGHDSAPFVWLETNPNNIQPIGGCSHFRDWVKEKFVNDADIQEANIPPSIWEGFDKPEPATYDSVHPSNGVAN